MSNYKRIFLLPALIIVFLLQLSLLLTSCSPKNYKGPVQYDLPAETHTPDYSKLYYWAAHPLKNDPSDEVPIDLKNDVKDTLADVFFIHPTTYTDKNLRMGWNADIDNEALNKKTDNSTILFQASVFNRCCRVFAPRYRQANLQAFFTSNKHESDAAFDTAYQDVKAAFEYYLKNYNRGRPIIIASHSQGTLHASRLLKEFFEGKALQKQLVCAYLVGLAVYTNYFSELKPCEDSTSTGCIIGWRTFKEGYVSPAIAREKRPSYVINPLTWTRDTAFAPAVLNKGGILRNFKKLIPGLVHAQIHGNILWVNKPRFFGDVFLTMKNYHIADYNLFYENIRENAGIRVRKFIQAQSSQSNN
jgi:hypothetical protein